MIASNSDSKSEPAPVIVLSIGNTTLSLAEWRDERVHDTQRFAIEDLDDMAAALRRLASEAEEGHLSAVTIASVVPKALKAVCKVVEDDLHLEPLVIGQKVPLPIDVKLEAPEAVGVDRICNAAAAFHANKQACVVVDCGTAITVDIVDDEGAFMGGAILPGLSMQAQSLQEHTAALPKAPISTPVNVIGQDTIGAIQSGIYYGAAGAVRGVVEAYATHLGRWPIVMATGGDIEMIARDCDIFDAVVPSLGLIGAGLAYDRRLNRAVSL